MKYNLTFLNITSKHVKLIALLITLEVITYSVIIDTSTADRATAPTFSSGLTYSEDIAKHLTKSKKKILRKERGGGGQKKNLRKKQKKKESKHEYVFEVEEVIEGITDITVKENDAVITSIKEDVVSSLSDISPELLQKKIRALRKKIKQIDDLEARLDNGDILEKEQLEKISKKDNFLEELSKLTSSA